MSGAARSQRSRNKQLAADTAAPSQEQNVEATKNPADAPTAPATAPTSHPSLTQEETLDILMQLSGGTDPQRTANGPAAQSPHGDGTLAQPRAPAPAASDASSSLSELDDDLDDQDEAIGDPQANSSSEDDDTEAETERLDISPEKNRTIPAGAAHTGLNRQAARDNNGLDGSEDELSADDEGPIAIQPLGADTTKGQNLTSAEAASRKRKRAASFGEPLRRRTGPTRLSEHKHADSESNADGDMEDDDLSDVPEEAAADKDPLDAAVKSPVSHKALDDDAESSGRELSEPPEDTDMLQETPAAVGGDAAEPEAEREEYADADADPETANAEAEVEGEEDEVDAAAKSEDELARKLQAMDALKPIENLFAIFRDKLYDERLAALSAELELLQKHNCQHHEYLEMQRTLNQRREEKIELEQTTLRYKVSAHERKIVAERAQIHSQFHQAVRELREEHMSGLNSRFSRIQQERRQFNAPKMHYAYKYEPVRANQLNNQRSYNKEVSLISGIAKYRGFPAAPSIARPQQPAIDDDMKKMHITPRTQHFKPNPQLTNIRLEETVRDENWLERNSWANPNHPTLQQARMHATAAAEGAYNTPARRPDMQYGLGSGSTIPFASDPPEQPASSPFEQMKRRNGETRHANEALAAKKPASPEERRRTLGVDYAQGEEPFNGGMPPDGLFTGGERVDVR